MNFHEHIPSPSQGNASFLVSPVDMLRSKKHRWKTITLKGAVLLQELRNKQTQWVPSLKLCAAFCVLKTTQNQGLKIFSVFGNNSSTSYSF